MDKRETRRVNPIAQIAFFAVAILVVFEALVIGGVLELKAQTVAKHAPWAYEPFLRVVGEHPDSAWFREPQTVESPAEGFSLSALPMETNAPESAATNLVIEPTTPVSVSTNPPPSKREEIVPVG